MAPASKDGMTPATDSPALTPMDPADLVTTSGSIIKDGPLKFAIRAASMRAELGRAPRAAVEIDFVYRGPSKEVAPLASGELRRQIGLKLRAQDTCNVVYAMWHIEPSPGIAVSVKANPGQSQHAQCGDRGYHSLEPFSSRAIGMIRAGERHLLRASVVGDELKISADGVVSWVGRLTPSSLAFDGPVGIRSDNGEFDVELRASASLGEEGSSKR